MRRKNRKLLMRRIRFIIIVALIAVCGSYIYNTFGEKAKDIAAVLKVQEAAPTEEIAEEVPKFTSIKISAIGDVALGQDYRAKHKNSFNEMMEKINYDYSYFFANVSDIFKNDDLTIANLENALTFEEERAEKYDYGNNYWFKGNPDYAKVLKVAGIDAVSLANNHTYDYMEKGYNDTRETLKNIDVGYFGYEDVYETEIKGVKIGIAGFNQLGNVEQGTDINELKAEIKEKLDLLKANNDFVIAAIHWGKEYAHEHNEIQTELGHFMIDNGADLVLGHHPHVIQGVEKYKDRYILYSLGNFCFGGNKNPPDYDTFIYQQEIVFDSEKKIAEIKEPDYIPCYISSVSGMNNFQPVPVKGNEITRILNKINKDSSYKMSEERIKEKSKPVMVNLREYIPELYFDLKYATTDNITGEILYDNDIPLLRKDTADKLKKAVSILAEKGYRIKVWDAYRPAAVQQKLWDAATDKTYFADPKKGSNHTRGCSVDITLTDMNGVELDMPSGFDEMSIKAGRTYPYATAEQKNNALLLEKAMLEAGFKSIKSEWWHFDDSDYKLYDLIPEYSIE